MRTRLLASLVLVLTLSLSIVTGVAAARGATLPFAVAITHLAGSGSGGASGTHSANHGAAVSKAAHTCAHGSHAVHGKCVRAVAKSAAGK
jgi:hypothetical protein